MNSNGKRILHPGEIQFFDGFIYIIYTSSETGETMLEKYCLSPEYDEPLNLKQIHKNLCGHFDGVIMVMYESWMHGEIYKFGNYGNWWYRCGTTMGFA